MKTAYLRKRQAKLDVYLAPPMERADHDKASWILLTTSYGLVNSNDEWKVVSDQALEDTSLLLVQIFPQLSYLKDRNGNVIAALAKIVDEFFCMETHTVDNVVESIQKSFKLSTATCRPVGHRYFGLNKTQHVDYTVPIDGDDKLNESETVPLAPVRCRESNDSLSPADQ